jgi:hypothetical protein
MEAARAGDEPGKLTPEMEVAWARAISCAFDDPAFYRRLKIDPVGVMREMGVDVTEDDVELLKPNRETLDKVIKRLEKQRDAVRAAQRPCAQPYTYAASYAASYAAPVQTQVVASVASSGCVAASGHSQTCGTRSCGFTAWGSIAASQVATTRAAAGSRAAPPQWLGGPPSAGVLATS